MKLLLPLFLFLSFPTLADENLNSKNINIKDVEQVVVFGIRPGPELWRVTNGENELWVLGTLQLLPKKMVWHSLIVEDVIADSQVMLMPPTADADIGFFKSLSLMTSIIGIKKNPEGKKLKDVVPEELYSRWLILKKKYMGRDSGIEKTRPIFASQELFYKAIKKIGLVNDTKVQKKVRKLAKKNKLEFITPKLMIEIEKPKAAIKKFKKSEISDLECFSTTLDRLEGDLKVMLLRANAWADGDILQIKQQKYPDQNKACGNAFLNSEVVQDTDMKDIVPRLRAVWLESAIKSLKENKSTFAILPISNLIGDNSYLDELSKLGYTVVVPK
jgi:hypothetical protein